MKRAISFLGLLFALGQAQAVERPNILWIYLEDVSGWFGCYGDKVIKTPHIDKLAAEGMRFTQCYAGSTVCAPSSIRCTHTIFPPRSCLMTALTPTVSLIFMTPRISA